MGRIKSTMVKKAARQFVATETIFNDTFDHNKKLLGSLMPSKPIRNKIAGYIARLIRMQNTAKAKKDKEALVKKPIAEETTSSDLQYA